ncbi:hypothetical protein [Demequina salsinemoris]|uniref:hypothetical protein n=1 Tax=Demequina salsinemoris TaxID=577470 RepID=UPI0007804A19|nr:hypothetical protein [Demequina salsinemoris]
MTQRYGEVFLPEGEGTSEGTSTAGASTVVSGSEAVFETPPKPPVDPAAASGRRLATPAGVGNGVVRCPSCGSSQGAAADDGTSFVCAHCRHEWRAADLDRAMGLSEHISGLQGPTHATAATNITSDDPLMAVACDGCGAEVVIDTERSLRAACPWCRHELSLSDAVPSGMVPDGILPFSVSKAQAWQSVQAAARRRWWFASKGFRQGLAVENLKRVYLPYMTVDVRANVRMDGFGEVELARSSAGETTTYQARRYAVMRQVEVEVDDLIVETGSATASSGAAAATTNILGAILPFDVKNAVRFDARVLEEDATVQRRELDSSDAGPVAAGHVLAIAREAARESVSQYDRYVQWEAEQARIEGTRWVSMLLPVWLYSHVEHERGGDTAHFIAVNGRTGATSSSIPMDRRRLALVSLGPTMLLLSPFFLIGLASLFLMRDPIFSLMFLLVPVPFVVAPAWIIRFVIKRRYRNAEARYEPEKVVARESAVVAGSDLEVGDVTSTSAGVPWPNSMFAHLRARHCVYFAATVASGSRLGPPPISTHEPYQADLLEHGIRGIPAQLTPPSVPRLIDEPSPQ